MSCATLRVAPSSARAEEDHEIGAGGALSDHRGASPLDGLPPGASSSLMRPLLAAAALVAAFAAPAFAAGLDAYLWKSRPVIVFAPERDQPEAADQLKRLAAARATLEDRDMPVFVVTRRQVSQLSGGRAPATLNAQDLRKTYGVADDAFAVVLVGKDGGEKLRSAEPVEAARLTDLVDTMPMRQGEAR